MAASNDGGGPRGIQILEIPACKAVQIYENESIGLASGPLSMLLVTLNLDDPYSTPPTSPEKADQDYSSDLWLVINIGSDFSLPVPASQRAAPERGTSSYFFTSDEIPGAGVRIFLPPSGSSHGDANLVSQFEEILNQYCAYQDDDRSDAGKVELLDEHGQIIGTLASGFSIEEDPGLHRLGHEKDPVVVDLASLASLSPSPMPSEGDSYLRDEKREDTLRISPMTGVGAAEPQTQEERDDWMLKGATYISRGMVRSSAFIGDKMTNAATSYTQRSVPATPVAPGYATTTEKAPSPPDDGRSTLRFKSYAQTGSHTLNQYSGKAVHVSSAVTSKIINVAGGIGSAVGRKTGIQRAAKLDGSMGEAPKGIRGVINRSLIAASTILDGVDTATQRLLDDGGTAASAVIGHKYGNEAQMVSKNVGGSVRNCWFVYRDFSGVRRKALLKVAGKSMVRARMDDGREVVLQVDERTGGELPSSDKKVDGFGASNGFGVTSGSGSGSGSGTATGASALRSTPSTSTSRLPPPPAHPSRSGTTTPTKGYAQKY